MKDKTIIHPITKQEIEFSFQYDDYIFYFNKDEIDEAKSTIAEKVSTNEIISGIEANQLLIEKVDKYCHHGGKVLISEEFKPVIKIYRKSAM